MKAGVAYRLPQFSLEAAPLGKERYQLRGTPDFSRLLVQTTHRQYIAQQPTRTRPFQAERQLAEDIWYRTAERIRD